MSWERVEKLIGTENLNRLSEKRIGVVGLGSGGGFVAQSLAMSGVGNFVLVDDDQLEIGNVVRHVADSRDVGRPKAQVAADLIKLRNPKANVEVFVGRIEQKMDLLDNLDILVVGVDGEQSKYIINEVCLKKNLTAVYAGVYERGEGGDVVVIHPFDGPCYACWASELREGLVITQKANQELDYGMIGEGGTLEAEPGLWLHVVKVAAIQSDLVLNELLRGSSISEKMPGNTLVIANNSLEIFEGQVNPPHTSVWLNIERDPQCLVCGSRTQRLVKEDQAISLDDLAASGKMAEIIFEENSSEPE